MRRTNLDSQTRTGSLNNSLAAKQAPPDILPVRSLRITANRKLRTGSRIPYLGRPIKIIKLYLPDEAKSVNLDGDRLLVNLNHQKFKLKPVVFEWYRQQSEKVIREKVADLSLRLGVSYSRVSVKGVKTRWGSCSHKGNLNFNWKLIMVPEPLIDHVVVHELCHLKEMNHSKKFWELVSYYSPRWREFERWLREH